MEIAFFDLEYTSWEGAKARNWAGEGEHREVIEIGAALVADPMTRCVLSTSSTYVKPAINPVLSDYIMRLTGVRQDQVEHGESFPEALDRLMAFLGFTIVWAYGLADIDVLVENCGLNGLDPFRLGHLAVRGVAPAFAAAGVDLATASTCDLAGRFGVPLGGRAHSALADAQSLAAASFVLIERGLVAP